MRLIAALLATLFVSAQASILVHQVAESHQICAEHGEQTHGDAHGTHTTSDGLAVSSDASGHDHCAVELFFEGEQPEATASAAAAMAPADLGSDSSITLVTRDLYRLAPKSSPPALRA